MKQLKGNRQCPSCQKTPYILVWILCGTVGCFSILLSIFCVGLLFARVSSPIQPSKEDLFEKCISKAHFQLHQPIIETASELADCYNQYFDAKLNGEDMILIIIECSQYEQHYGQYPSTEWITQKIMEYNK